MTRIVAFAKHLAYETGGAEVSTRALLTRAAESGHEVTVVSVADACFAGKPMPRARLPQAWRTVFIPDFSDWPRFPYYEYAANRTRLKQLFSTMEGDELWTYGLHAPAAMQGFRGRCRYFVRSESDVGILGNYQTGWRRVLKSAHNLAQGPAWAAHLAQLRRACRRAQVVANSRYMAQQAAQRLGVEPAVDYPVVDVTSLRARLAQAQVHAQTGAPQWVVFVGDSSWKGLNIVRQIAPRLPQLRFRIVSRLVDTPRDEGNIRWMPWQSESWRIYESARLVIAPSQCNEAYGRVSREAYLLGLPVLVSGVGGMPESVDHDAASIVHDFRRAEAWIHAIETRLQAPPPPATASAAR